MTGVGHLPNANPPVSIAFRDDVVEAMAKVMHEAGREAVEKRMIYRSDLPVKPFAEWDQLDEPTKEGRRMMARHVLSKYPSLAGHIGRELDGDCGETEVTT